MDIKNIVSPNKLFGNSPVNNVNNQNKRALYILKNIIGIYWKEELEDISYLFFFFLNLSVSFTTD